MKREDRIRKCGTSIYWKMKLYSYFLTLNLEYIQIVLIEEIIKYEYYIGFIKVKTNEKEKYVQIIVFFDKRGKPEIHVLHELLERINRQFVDGNLLLCNI